MQDWLPGYEHDPEPGAGLGVGPGADKVVLHTTESPRGSYAGVRNLWRGSSRWGAGLPHFLADGTRVVQLLPLSVNAYTMENHAGGADTNRAGHVIQVEWCRYAKDPWQSDELKALAQWLADLKANGLNYDINTYPRFYGAGEGVVLASYSSPIRMGADAWTNFNGWCGHQHAPENAHWDPGFIDGGYVARLANGFLSTEVPEEEQDVTVICRGSDGRVFACWGLFKRHLNQEEVNGFLFMGAKDLGTNDGFLKLLSEIPRKKVAGTDA